MFPSVITLKKSEKLLSDVDALTFILGVLYYTMHLETAYLPISFVEKSLALLLLHGLGIVYAESFSGLIWLIRRSKYMSRQHRGGKWGGLTQLLARLAR